MDSSRRIRRRRIPQLLAISVLVVGATLSPAEALTKPLDRVATGQALAEVCNAANERELDVVDVFGDIEDSSPPARWRAYIDEMARIQTKTQAAFLAIRPQPGVDGGLTTKINALIARETKTLKSAQSLARRGRVSAALDVLRKATASFRAQELALQNELLAYGFPFCQYFPGDEPDARTAPAKSAPVDPAYFPTVPGTQMQPLDGIELEGVGQLAKALPGVYAAIEGRRITLADGTAGLVVVFVTVPAVAGDPNVTTKLNDAATKTINGAPFEPVNGFTTVAGTFSVLDKVVAFRPGLLVEFTAPSAVNQLKVKDLARAYLALLPALSPPPTSS